MAQVRDVDKIEIDEAKPIRNRKAVWVDGNAIQIQVVLRHLVPEEEPLVLIGCGIAAEHGFPCLTTQIELDLEVRLPLLKRHIEGACGVSFIWGGQVRGMDNEAYEVASVKRPIFFRVILGAISKLKGLDQPERGSEP